MMYFTHLNFALLLAAHGSARLFTVPLMKQDVPVLLQGRVVAHKSAYFGKVEVGLPEPQNFTVVFDTGSGHFFLPSAGCSDEPCLLHQRYNRSASASASDINHDGAVISAHDDMGERDQVSIAYGTGEIVGEFVKEIVCVGDFARSLSNARGDPTNCARIRVITAQQMTPEPFNNFKFDGVLGLGLEGLALDPEFHFLGQMTRGSDLLPMFGVYLAPWGGRRLHDSLAKDDSPVGEITFGGHDERRVSGPISWAPVLDPENGHWQIKIHSVRVGDTAIPLCDDGTCTGILDTGTSLLGVPKESHHDLLWKTAREVSSTDQAAADARGDASVDCREVAGLPLIFDLGDGLEVVLEAKDYSRPAPTSVNIQGEAHTICRSSLLPIDMQSLGNKVFIWGEPVLRRYYTAYDGRQPSPRVGFATLKVPSVESSPGSTPSFRGAADTPHVMV